MRLSREAIQRMVGFNSGFAIGGGGGIDAAMLAGYATQEWVDENYLSIEFFSRLFRAHSANGEVVPNDVATTVTDIQAMFGFWTASYISALGQNAGGGGGAMSLAGLVDVEIISPQTGQVLMYDGTSGKWYNGAGGGGGGGGITSITAGTGLSGGTITTSGTIAIDSTYQGYIQKGVTAYGWGNHANAGYLTSVSGTLWGQSFTNGGTVTGSMSGVGSIAMGNYLSMNTNQNPAKPGLLIEGYWESSTGVQYITLGYHGTAGNTQWQIVNNEDVKILQLMVEANNTVAKKYALVKDALRIGDGMLMWDSTNNAFKIIKADGTAANMYATGGVSALGMSAGVSAVDAMTFGYLTVNNQINFVNGSYSNSIKTGTNGRLVLTAAEGVDVYEGMTIHENDLVLNNVDLRMNGNYIYLNSTCYLHMDGSDLKLNISGTDYTLVKNAS